MCRCFLFVFFSSSNKQWRRQNRNNKQCINKHMESRRFVLLFFICTLFENSICLASYPASCQFCIRKMVLCMLRCYSSLDAHRSIPIDMPKNSIMFEIRYQVYYMRRFSWIDKCLSREYFSVWHESKQIFYNKQWIEDVVLGFLCLLSCAFDTSHCCSTAYFTVSFTLLALVLFDCEP